MTPSIMAECCYAERHFYQVSCMLSVVNKPFMLTVIVLNVIILSVIMLSVIMLSVIMLSVIMLSVICSVSYAQCHMLSVMSPNIGGQGWDLTLILESRMQGKIGGLGNYFL